MKNRINRYVTLQWNDDGVFWVGFDKFIHCPDGRMFVYRKYRRINDGDSIARLVKVTNNYSVIRKELTPLEGRVFVVMSLSDFDLWRGDAIDRSSVSSFDELLRLSADDDIEE